MKSLLKSLTLGTLSIAAGLFWVSVQAAQTSPTITADIVGVVAADPTALAGSSSGAFIFVRTGSTNDDLNVSFAYSGTALLGTDFNEVDSKVGASGARYLKISKGFYASDLVIVAKVNPKLRGNKTVDVTLDPALLGPVAIDPQRAQAEVRIVDDTYNDSPPTVSLASPADNSIYALPAVVVIRAETGDLEDAVQKVSFYANDDFLGSATASPFTFSWVNPAPGEYDLFARVVDAAGKSTLSRPVHVSVKGVPATVAISSPHDKATVDPLSDLPIEVAATGAGNLTVQIAYDITHLLAELKTPPYAVTWSKVPAGKHTITAQVTDALGQSASASIQVSVLDLPPTVKIMSPATGASFTEGTDITFRARVTDPDDAIKDVTFWANHRVLGKGTLSADQSAYEFKWTGVKANFYLVTAVATNSRGTTGTSDVVYVSVSAK